MSMVNRCWSCGALDPYGMGCGISCDPPLPRLASPDPVTIHDLSPEVREKVKIRFSAHNQTRQWELPS